MSYNPTQFTWEIDNFKDVTHHDYKEFSPNDESTFRIDVYPNGTFEGHRLYYTLIELQLDYSSKQDDKAHFRLSIVGGEKNMSNEGTLLKMSRHHKPFHQLSVYRDALFDERNGLLQDGTLVIMLEIYEKPPNLLCIECGADETYEVESVFQDFDSLLQEGKNSDVTIVVDGKEFALHQAILAARSPVFAAMFGNDFKEKNENRVEISDISVSMFEDLLRYIYTGKIPSIKEHGFDLFVVADMYQLESLKTLCEETLSAELTVETAAKMYLLADMHNASLLKEECVEFISKNLADVRVSDEWKDLLAANRTDLLDQVIQAI